MRREKGGRERRRKADGDRQKERKVKKENRGLGRGEGEGEEVMKEGHEDARNKVMTKRGLEKTGKKSILFTIYFFSLFFQRIINCIVSSFCIFVFTSFSLLLFCSLS